MGTKIQTNGFFKEYHSVIDLDGGTNNGMKLVYQENPADENGNPPGSCTPSGLGCDLKKARRTILEQELTFRNQLQELHRLYRRQKELMDVTKQREANNAATKEEKPQSSFLVSGDSRRAWNASHSSSLKFPTFVEGKVVPNFAPSRDARILGRCEPWFSKSSICPKGAYDLRIQADVSSRDEKRMQERFFKFSGVGSVEGSRNHQVAHDRDTRLSLGAVEALQCNADALTFDLYTKRHSRAGDVGITDRKDGIRDGLVLSRGLSVNSTLNLMTNDFFQNSLDGINNIRGFENDRSRKEHPSDDYTEKTKFDRCYSVGGSCSGKFPAFPQPPVAEQSKSLTQRRRKLFGIELEGCDDDSPSDALSALEPKVGSSLWIDKSLAQNLDVGRMDSNGRKAETLKAGTKDKASSQGNSSYHSNMAGKWLQGCSAVGLSLDKVPGQADSDRATCFMSLKPANVLRKDSEHCQKFQCSVPQSHTMLAVADCRNSMKNPEGEFPWFLMNKQDIGNSNKGMISPYFMNLHSLQSCSQNFFRKTETADGATSIASEAAQQKKEILAEGGADELNERSTSTGANKILGFPVSDMIHTSDQDLNSKLDLANMNCSAGDVDSAMQTQHGDKNRVLQKVLDADKSELRHQIDLNLSVDEEAPPSAPSLPTTTVQIVTTETVLEVPSVAESEIGDSPKEANSGKSESTCEECDDKTAAEALLAIASHRNPVHDSIFEPTNSSCLKWFVEIVSSQGVDTASIHQKDESLSDGMDHFEYMTLQLEETEEEHYRGHEPYVLNNQTDDEAGDVATTPKRPRRGQSGRGRLRKDFQRDILPGMTTLSRLEVTEDFQAFEELMKPEGGALRQPSSTRNGRGRKRWGGPSGTQRQPVCQLQDWSLTGWGKRTRRLPRQRCPNALLSFAVKC